MLLAVIDRDRYTRAESGRRVVNMGRVALVLADGGIYYGTGFGAAAPSVDDLDTDRHPLDGLIALGEVVFNTAMSGYGEVLTDPSYTGQIVVMTYPEIGNYGIDTAWAESNPDDKRPVKTAGFVVHSLYDGPVPHGRITLDRYLANAGVPGICSVDTRALTLDLRDNGSRNALIVAPQNRETLTAEELSRVHKLVARTPAMEGRDLLASVGLDQTVVAARGDGPHLAMYDCGIKSNIIREFRDLGCTLTVLPATAAAEEIESLGSDAFFVANGPGDPAVLRYQVEQTKKLIGRLPVLGICLGHQIIAEARGAQTEKMKFGHHGVNHPVRDELGGRVFVTSQNHGFTVNEESLPDGMTVWFRNANDGTIEGLRDDSLAIRTTQFHPESAPGPHDSRWIFRAFLEAIPGYADGET